MLSKNWQNDKLLESLSLKRVFLFNLYVVISTIFFGIISFIPLLFFRFQAPVRIYQVSLFSLFVGLFFLSPVALIILLSVVLSVETFFFLDSRRETLFVNILVSSLLSVGFLYLSFVFFQDYDFVSQLGAQLEPLKQKFLKDITPEVWGRLQQQLPSFIITGFSFLLFFSLRYISYFKIIYTKLEAKELGLSSISHKTYLPKLKNKSFNFSIPVWFIWLFILSFALSFISLSIPEVFKHVGFNVLNICFGFYFLQGLGVVGEFFALFKFKKTTKKLLYILVFIYFFSFVSVLGFLDYWFNFKVKLKLYKVLNKKNPK